MPCHFKSLHQSFFPKNAPHRPGALGVTMGVSLARVSLEGSATLSPSPVASEVWGYTPSPQPGCQPICPATDSTVIKPIPSEQHL